VFSSALYCVWRVGPAFARSLPQILIRGRLWEKVLGRWISDFLRGGGEMFLGTDRQRFAKSRVAYRVFLFGTTLGTVVFFFCWCSSR